MRRKKLLKTLGEFFDWKTRKQRKHASELTVLIEKLQEKEAELEERLLKEKGKQRRERLRKKLEIVKAQRAKGMRVLESLQEPEAAGGSEEARRLGTP